VLFRIKKMASKRRFSSSKKPAFPLSKKRKKESKKMKKPRRAASVLYVLDTQLVGSLLMRKFPSLLCEIQGQALWVLPFFFEKARKKGQKP